MSKDLFKPASDEQISSRPPRLITTEDKENLVSTILCNAFGEAAQNGIAIDPRFDYEKCARDIVKLFDSNFVLTME